jgi:hypothetical protein
MCYAKAQAHHSRRSWAVLWAATLASSALVAGAITISAPAAAATTRSMAAGPLHVPIIDGHSIQPNAGEFRPPYGSPDIPNKDGRTLDEIYRQLMRPPQYRYPLPSNGGQEEPC